MHCPIDGKTLKILTYEGVDIASCETCGGEFVGGAQLQRIVSLRDERFDAVVREVIGDERRPRFGVPADERPRALACPECASDMHVVNYAGDTAVYVDRCGVCGGIWLDHHELEAIQVILERWQDEAPEQFLQIAGELVDAQQRSDALSRSAFAGSRFAFVNAIINRLLDAA